MLRADVLTLVEESPKAHGVLETPQETTRKVYCTMRSIGQSEVYQAKAAGLAPEIKLVLAHAFEYKGEKRCVFRDVPYRIIRTYIKETDEAFETYTQKEYTSAGTYSLDQISEFVERFIDMLGIRLLVDQRIVDFDQSGMDVILEAFSLTGELEVSVSVFIHVHDIGEMIIVCIIQIQIELMVSCQIQCKQIRAVAVGRIDQCRLRLSVTIQVDQYLVLLSLADRDLVHLRCFFELFLHLF